MLCRLGKKVGRKPSSVKQYSIGPPIFLEPLWSLHFEARLYIYLRSHINPNLRNGLSRSFTLLTIQGRGWNLS